MVVVQVLLILLHRLRVHYTTKLVLTYSSILCLGCNNQYQHPWLSSHRSLVQENHQLLLVL